MKARRSVEHQKIISIIQENSLTDSTFQLIQWLDDVCKMHDYYKQMIDNDDKS